MLAALSAAAPVAGWLLVEEATDNGIRAGDDDRLVLAVLAYVAVNAAAWVLGTLTWLGLASIGQRIVLELRRDLFHHLTSLSLRYFSQQKAGWIISRLNERRRRALRRAQPGPDDARRQHAHARRRGRRPLPARLAARPRRALHPPARRSSITRWFQRVSHVAAADVRTKIAIVTAQLAESVAGMAVIQAFNRERAFQAEFDGLNEENRVANVARAEDLLRLLPGDRAARRDRDGCGALRRRAVHRRRLDGDRDADRGRRPARARLPAAAGAVRAVRPGAGGERGDGQDQLGARRRDRRRRQAGRARRSAGSTAGSSSTASRSPTARSRCCTGSRSRSRRAAASRSSASPAAASRRPRS